MIADLVLSFKCWPQPSYRDCKYSARMKRRRDVVGVSWQAMLDMQLHSIKSYSAASWGPDIAVHVITQRYAQLTTSLLLLNADYQARAVMCIWRSITLPFINPGCCMKAQC